MCKSCANLYVSFEEIVDLNFIRKPNESSVSVAKSLKRKVKKSESCSEAGDNRDGFSSENSSDEDHSLKNYFSDKSNISLRNTEQSTSGKLEGQVKSQRRRRPVHLNVNDKEDKKSELFRQEDLLSNPDLYPVPKGTPFCTPIETLTTSDSQVQSRYILHEQLRKPSTLEVQLQTPTVDAQLEKLSSVQREEASLQSQIRDCLEKIKSRNSNPTGSGSFEAGLYRLENLLNGRTTPGEGKNLANVKKSLTTESKDASTVTDICSDKDVDEVEIISLVQETIPKYKLRADVFSKFSGIDEEGWCVPFPALQDEQTDPLSPEQAEGALAYFVLCGNRVNQMTKTYHDIDAVTRLLEEKEKDLELAARIGQQLLARNRLLEDRITSLEAELLSSTDCITQLRHNLHQKTELLQIYTNDVDENSRDATPTGQKHMNVELLEKRVYCLESENKELKKEASQLAFDTQDCEEKEKQLMNDLIKQLNDANSSVFHMSDELTRKVDDSLRQQDETTFLLANVAELQAANKQCVSENEELSAMLEMAKQCQEELTTELAGFKERYVEVLDLLHDAQQQLRKAKKGSLHMRSCRSTFHGGILTKNDSIANELHLSSTSGDEDSLEGSKVVKRIFDTVKSSGRLSNMEKSSHYTQNFHSTPLSAQLNSSLHTTDSRYLGGISPYSSIYSTNNSGLPSLDSGADSDASIFTDSEDCYPVTGSGVPGWPGTPDLENCLRRLERTSVTLGSRTPDSIMSTGSAKMSSRSVNEWKMPQKLQIIKPIEGSLTLHQWSRLATPHLGGLLQEREGVVVKGETTANMDVYSISDIEEDDADSGYPGKQFMGTSGIFTYTNSTVLHPDDITNLTSSLNKTQPSVLPAMSASYNPSSVPGTPCHGSRRGSTATFSTNTGIAKHLNERGIVNGGNISYTVTPANTPDRSRPCSPDSSAYKLPGFDDLTKTIYYGADFLRRKLYGTEDVPVTSAVAKINLLEKVHSFGGETTAIPNTKMQLMGGVVAVRPRTLSPLAHLSNLIRNSTKPEDKIITSPTHIGTPGNGDFDRKIAEIRPRKYSKPGQRLDLGKVDKPKRPDTLHPKTTVDSSNMGTVSWTSMGRKGGFL